MKYILTLVLLVLLSSCNYKESQPPIDVKMVRISNAPSIYKFTFEGHDYLYGYRTSMIHSASCKSPEHYDN